MSEVKTKFWRRYYDLEPYRRLRNEGRELLGEEIYLTEKRDGENISTWLDDKEDVRISSHNLEDASEDIKQRLKLTPEWPKICDLLGTELHSYGHRYILYGELMKKVSPTRIEREKKHTHWILFDIWDGEKWIPYNRVYQYGYQWKIPVVEVIDVVTPSTMEDLQSIKEKFLKWARRHRREGFVAKIYYPKRGEQLMFKERVDLPPRIKPLSENKTVNIYPPMPEDRILRALQHAFDEVGEENWHDRSKAMPSIARHISTEAREHNYNTPAKSLYQIYLDTSVEKLKAK